MVMFAVSFIQKKFYFILCPVILICSSLVCADEVVNIHHKPKIFSGWVKAEQLQLGMKVLTADDQLLSVHQVWKEKPKSETTYNFTVKNHHTYFISKQKIWAHNICWRFNKTHDDVNEMLGSLSHDGRMSFNFKVNSNITRLDDILGRKGHVEIDISNVTTNSGPTLGARQLPTTEGDVISVKMAGMLKKLAQYAKKNNIRMSVRYTNTELNPNDFYQYIALPKQPQGTNTARFFKSVADKLFSSSGSRLFIIE